MNKLAYLILYIFLTSLLVNCKEGDFSIPPCKPSQIENDSKFFSDQVGILKFTDSLWFKLSTPNYFIFSPEVTYLPLTPCNLPESEFQLEEGEQIDILFSGYINSYALSDAISIPIELTDIKKLH